MKIATMVRGYIPVPQPADIIYTPIGLAIDASRQLIKRGHSVDFYAPTGSKLDIPLKTLNLKPLVRGYKSFNELLNNVDLLTHYIPSLWDQYLAGEMFKRAAAGDYDLLHFHHPETAMPFAKLYPEVPVVYSLHDPVFKWYKDLYKLYNTPNQFYISISNNQRNLEPELPYVKTVYNGISIDNLKFSNEHDNYLLFVGRISPEKGVKEAIEIARKTKHKLLIIGQTYDHTLRYFQRHVEPELDDQIQFLGYINHNKIAAYFRKAKAFLAPIQWEEPFGVTMVEAMACGTPVIGLKRGSIPEIVVNGKTGYINSSIRGMIQAVGKIDKLDRRDCREHVKNNFSIKKMADGYEEAYETVLKKMNKKPSST
jgi:glycosyltransferase involved in cell wall biosynthesis